MIVFDLDHLEYDFVFAGQISSIGDIINNTGIINISERVTRSARVRDLSHLCKIKILFHSLNGSLFIAQTCCENIILGFIIT